MNINDIRFDVRDGLVIVQVEETYGIDPYPYQSCQKSTWRDAIPTDILDIADVLTRKYQS